MNTTPSPAREAVELPPVPANVSHVTRRVRACEGEVPAQLVLEHAMRTYALKAQSDMFALAERLKQEAQIHAQEARTANATIAEIYQLCTGATGEPGNWNGAEPVRALLAAKQEEVDRMREALEICANTLESFVESGAAAADSVIGKNVARARKALNSPTGATK